MRARAFGKRCGGAVAPVSIGAMRLPADAIDAVGLVRHAIDSGMRYIDTSRGYGESELILVRALRGGYREKVLLSSKCSPWIKKVQEGDVCSDSDFCYQVTVEPVLDEDNQTISVHLQKMENK